MEVATITTTNPRDQLEVEDVYFKKKKKKGSCLNLSFTYNLFSFLYISWHIKYNLFWNNVVTYINCLFYILVKIQLVNFFYVIT